MPKTIQEAVFEITHEKTKAELIDYIEKQLVIINGLRSLDNPEVVEDINFAGTCPACTKQTNNIESPYRCRYCGKALIWNIPVKPQKGDQS